jgi:hypothetical protein
VSHSGNTKAPNPKSQPPEKLPNLELSKPNAADL